MALRLDIFCSYARADNDDGWVARFTDKLLGTHRKLTGESPRCFLDTDSVLTSDLWEEKINAALKSSRLLLAIISPSFIRSEWCRREWNRFLDREDSLRRTRLLPDDQGLIFPVLLFPLDRGKFDTDQKIFADQVRKRQWMDVSSRLMGTPIRVGQLRQLAESMIDITAELEVRGRVLPKANNRSRSDSTIVDSSRHLQWKGSLSPKELTFDEAREFITALNKPAEQGWRLPTKSELDGLVDRAALVDDPHASPFPLRPPFNAQRFGYLPSGTLVNEDSPDYGNFIMNVRNGHIFNGLGCKCYVRAVRGIAARPGRPISPT